MVVAVDSSQTRPRFPFVPDGITDGPGLEGFWNTISLWEAQERQPAGAAVTRRVAVLAGVVPKDEEVGARTLGRDSSSPVFADGLAAIRATFPCFRIK